jgi:transporter family-2 protein
MGDLLVLLAGALLPLQAGVNAELARHLGHPLRVSFASFGAEGLFLLLFLGVFLVRRWAWWC